MIKFLKGLIGELSRDVNARDQFVGILDLIPDNNLEYEGANWTKNDVVEMMENGEIDSAISGLCQLVLACKEEVEGLSSEVDRRLYKLCVSEKFSETSMYFNNEGTLRANAVDQECKNIFDEEKVIQELRIEKEKGTECPEICKKAIGFGINKLLVIKVLREVCELTLSEANEIYEMTMNKKE